MVNDEKNTKARNRKIARNESARQMIGDIRVSAWAIGIAVIAALVVVTWILVKNR
ncbi:MAG TPA: hypothetical protein VJV58_03060 [Bradyrhizobium sp.]|nr:hypothetical protein [Bradyrhizobium sp.]